MLIEMLKRQPRPEECGDLFRLATGARVRLRLPYTRVTPPGDGPPLRNDAPPTFHATATDLFLKLDGVPHRLFVDVDVLLPPCGLRHVFLPDGPTVEDAR